MKKIAKALALCTITLACMAVSTTAEAQQPGAAKPAAVEKGGYEYRFSDDLMQGDSMGANAPRITVRKMGRRDRLLRPRLHFVPEMLKSVEKM
jgi:hypothetical protein